MQVGAFYIQGLTLPDDLEQRLELAHEMEASLPRLTNLAARWDALPVQPAWEAGRLDEVERNDELCEALVAEVPFQQGRVVTAQHRGSAPCGQEISRMRSDGPRKRSRSDPRSVSGSRSTRHSSE